MLHEPVTRRRCLLDYFRRLPRPKQAELLKQLHDAHYHPKYPATIPHAAARR